MFTDFITQGEKKIGSTRQLYYSLGMIPAPIILAPARFGAQMGLVITMYDSCLRMSQLTLLFLFFQLKACC